MNPILYKCSGAAAALLLVFFLGRFSVSSPDPEPVQPTSRVSEPTRETRQQAASDQALQNARDRVRTQVQEAEQAAAPAPVEGQVYEAAPSESARSMFSKAINDPRVLASRAGLAMAALAATPDDIPSLVRAYENRPPGGDSMYASIMLMTAWGQFDGPAAVAYAEENMDGWQVRIGAETAMEAWAESNPDAVVEWLSTQENPELENWFPGVVAGVALHNLPLAADLMNNMEYGRLRGRAADHVLDAYQRLGTQNMLAYVNGVEDEKLLPGLQRKAAARLAEAAPDQFTSWVMGIDGEENQRGALTTYVQTWARSDPEKAIDFLNDVDDESLKDAGLNTVLSTWVREDIAAAAEWVSNLDAGRVKDSSLSQVANGLVRNQPSVALEYALQIADGQTRLNTVKRVTEQWVRRDPEGAAEVLGEETVQAAQAALKTSGRGPDRRGGGIWRQPN